MRPVTNVSRRTRWGVFGLIGCAVAVPIVAVGFSVRPGLKFRAMQGEMRQIRASVEALPSNGDLRILAAERLRMADRGAALDAVADALDDLLPNGCDLIELFDDVRRVGRQAGIELQAISPGTTLPLESSDHLGSEVTERVPCATELSLLGSCRLLELADFVRGLRAAGHPTEVRSVNLSRAATSSERFRFQLTLGMQHRGGAASGRGELSR